LKKNIFNFCPSEVGLKRDKKRRFVNQHQVKQTFMGHFKFRKALGAGERNKAGINMVCRSLFERIVDA